MSDRQKLLEPIFSTPLEHPEHHANTLGWKAVHGEEFRVASVTRADDLREWASTIDVNGPSDEYAKKYITQDAEVSERRAADSEAAVSEELQIVRDELAGLSDRSRDGMESILEEHLPPFFRQRRDVWAEAQREAKGEAQQPKKGSRLLGKLAIGKRKKPASVDPSPDPTPWVSWLSSGASDPELMNYLQWHTARMDEMHKNPEIQEMVANERAQYKERLTKAVKDGWLHPEAKGFLSQVDDIPVVISDYYDGSKHWNADGYARHDTKLEISKTQRELIEYPKGVYIIEPVGEQSLKQQLEETATHEFDHFLGYFGPTWSNEAWTEHIALALKHGDWKAVSPKERTDEGAYTDFRELLATVLEPIAEDGKRFMNDELAKETTVTTFTWAYSVQHQDTWEKFNESVHKTIEGVYGHKSVFEAIQMRLDVMAASMPNADDPNYKYINLSAAAGQLVDEWKDLEKRREIISEYENYKVIKDNKLNEEPV